MIISPGRRYIFVHIPKTGGTSLAHALEARAKKDDILIGDTEKARRRRRRVKRLQAGGRLWKHSTLADIAGVVSEEEIADWFCFTLVRNPWDRMVSYYHWLQNQSFDHPAVGLAKSLSFSEFLREPHILDAFASNHAATYMTTSRGEHRADLYIRLEHFEQDVEPLWSHLGFRLEMPHLNRSNRKSDYRNLYSGADAEQLAALCSKDIEQFGYTF
ncbi:MAG: sulfotransferase family 2 domain-containing protein [Pseudomonadota bacterium]